jgi:diguanylate cyclase (GGDEF)-like protein
MAGICGVLLVLTSFALWAASRTNQAALHAADLTHINDAYQQARFAVTAEELLEHKYRLEPSPDVRVRFERAARSLDATVAFLLRHGDEADRQPVRTLTADHRRYVEGVHRLFDAVDAGDQRQVREIQEDNGPLFDKIAAQVEEGAAHERDETLEGLGALRSHVVVATPVIFGAGLGLLVVFCVVLVGYQRRTERQALHDGLTGLPNRTLLHDRTGQAIRQADRELVPAALALIDLDRFKEVNDTLGHHYGDQLLIQVGQRLQGALRAVDTVARLGGDEFAVLLHRVESAEGAVKVANKLQAALEQPFVLDGLSLDVEASIGVALYPEHGNDPEELLQHADIAMYVAKDTHAGFVLFDPTLDQHSPRRWPCWASCAAPSTSTSCCCTTSPRSTPTPAKSSGWRRWCAGNTPNTA